MDLQIQFSSEDHIFGLRLRCHVCQFLDSSFLGLVLRGPERPMHCAICSSDDLKVLNGELAVHFSGWEGLNRRPVLVYPDMIVCLACGHVEFELPAEYREQLRTVGTLQNYKTINF